MNQQNHALGSLSMLALSITALVFVLCLNLFSVFYKSLHETNAFKNSSTSMYVVADNVPPRAN